MKEYPEPLNRQCIQKIYEQMNNSIYQIKENKDIFRYLFFLLYKI